MLLDLAAFVEEGEEFRNGLGGIAEEDEFEEEDEFDDFDNEELGEVLQYLNEA